jgi:hypothetical protein
VSDRLTTVRDVLMEIAIGAGGAFMRIEALQADAMHGARRPSGCYRLCLAIASLRRHRELSF